MVELKLYIKTQIDAVDWCCRRVWAIAPKLVLVVVALALIKSIFPAGMAIVTRYLINAVIATIEAGTPELDAIYPWLALSLAFSILHSVSVEASGYFSRCLTDQINLKITEEIMVHSASLDLSFFETPKFQDIVARVNSHTAQHLSRFVMNVIAAITSSLQLLSLLAVLIVIEPLIILACIPLTIPYYVFQRKLSRDRFLEKHDRVTKQRWTRYSLSLLTAHDKVPEVKLLGLAPYLIRRYHDVIKGFRDRDRTIYRRHFFGKSAFLTLANIAFFATFVRAISRAVHGSLTVGDVVIYGGASSGLRSLLDDSVLLFNAIYEDSLHITEFRAFLNLSPDSPAGSASISKPVIGEIEFDGVSFAYPGNKRHVVQNVSIKIGAGEIVALVGENAAGKSTIAKLIAGLYYPSEGAILIDGTDSRKWQAGHLSSQISFVFQNFIRYQTTIHDNIAYGDWQRLIGNPEEVEKIAHRVRIHDMISDMADGFDTEIGRMFGNRNLSGGQWQNLAIARALAKKSSILIFDEPTSNLDSRKEYDLFAKLKQLAEGRTTILISHRFSTVSLADRIIMLDQGRVVEQGPHEELLALGGAYASLYRIHQTHLD